MSIYRLRLQEMFLGCLHTLHREMNLILWMQSTAVFLKCQNIFSSKQERRKWAASAQSGVFPRKARQHKQITQVRSIFHGNTEYSLPPDMVQYTDQLLGWRFLGHWSQSQPSNHDPLIIQSSDMLLYFLSFTCRFPFHFTSLKKGSPYDTAPLCFLYLGVQGAFLLKPEEAFETGRFKLKEEAKKWPLMCHTDPSSGTIQVSIKSGD